jgi:hypothetical protein
MIRKHLADRAFTRTCYAHDQINHRSRFDAGK